VLVVAVVVVVVLVVVVIVAAAVVLIVVILVGVAAASVLVLVVVVAAVIVIIVVVAAALVLIVVVAAAPVVVVVVAVVVVVIARVAVIGFFFPSMTRQSPVGQDLLIIAIILKTHHTWQDSSGRAIGLTHRPLPDNIKQSQETDTHAPDGVRTHGPYKQAAADPRFRPRGSKLLRKSGPR